MHVLIAEDDRVTGEILARTLQRWSYSTTLVSDGAQAWDRLRAATDPTLAILDWMMPEMDGVEVCSKVRDRTGSPYVYILLLSAKSQREDLVKGMESGADDYITKPFDANELKVRLRAGRRILDLQTQLMETQEALRDQAARDPLTGIWNRKTIFDVFHRELSRTERERSQMAIVMIDIDHFGNLNNTYGHLAGDAALREFTRRMTASLRPYDSVGRYGGEEFLVLLPGCNTADGMAHAERLRGLISDVPFDTSEGRYTVTCSLGVASSCGVEGFDTDTLIRAADGALYKAKRNGRNRVESC
jgi:diguanylate cyclase (GGDEF)-like protein